MNHVRHAVQVLSATTDLVKPVTEQQLSSPHNLVNPGRQYTTLSHVHNFVSPVTETVNTKILFTISENPVRQHTSRSESRQTVNTIILSD